MAASPDHLRIAFLVYRGNPHSGGQGVYTRYISRELVAMGHDVTVFSGQPYPVLDEGVEFVPVPSLDLYRSPDPFRVPTRREFRDRIDVAEFGLMCTAGFPEPLTFSWRIRRELAARVGQFDIVHDNQCFGRGIAGLLEDGWPLVATLHHPITVDRDLDIAHARTFRRRLTLRRWYGFLGMQMRVAARVPRIITVSESSRRDIVAQMGVPDTALHVVPVGVDHTHFRPLPEISRVPGRIMTTTSSDMPLKGLVPLLEAVAKLRTERSCELVVIGKPRAESELPRTIDRLGLNDCVTFLSGVSDQRIVELYAETELAVVPSLYEGFSLPAIEAMACGVPLVATTGGALPEVVGESGRTGLLVPPGDPGALALAIGRLFDDPALRARLAEAGRQRVLERFTWRACAEGTVAQYYEELGRTPPAVSPC
jgi:glycosyltransferase involved in cell wall biosynthesis